MRRRDLEQLQQLAERFPDRHSLITDIALDPPTSTTDLPQQAGRPDDYLVLSTVHSAKGLEWDVVYTISALDGTFPFSRAQNVPEQLEEERRLFYVALTRARNWLYVTYPQQTYLASRGKRVRRFLRVFQTEPLHHAQSEKTLSGDVRV